MKKGQQIRNVSDNSMIGGITVGSIYTLTSDAQGYEVFFQDDDGFSRMRPRHNYELVQPEDDKVLVFLKDRAKELQSSPIGSWERARYSMVLEFLGAHYGLKVKVTPQVEFVPING